MTPGQLTSPTPGLTERSLINCCEEVLRDYGNYTEHPAYRVAQALHEHLTADTVLLATVRKKWNPSFAEIVIVLASHFTDEGNCVAIDRAAKDIYNCLYAPLPTPPVTAETAPEEGLGTIADPIYEADQQWHRNERELRDRIDAARPEMQTMIEDDLAPGGLFDYLRQKSTGAEPPTPAVLQDPRVAEIAKRHEARAEIMDAPFNNQDDGPLIDRCAHDDCATLLSILRAGGM